MSSLPTVSSPISVASPAVATSLEALLFRYGRSYDSYLGIEPGRDVFWSLGHDTVVTFVRNGRYLHISGGLIAPADRKTQLLTELVDHATAQRLTLLFYNVPEDELPLFREFGFQITKWGEEALLDLSDDPWRGGDYEWVRRQINYCRRQGVVCAECLLDELSPDQRAAVIAELTEVSAEPLALKPQAEDMSFLEGRLDLTALGRRRLFIARADAGQGRIEGFLICNPCENGAMWAFELYRYRTNSVRGTIPFLMAETMRRLRDESVSRISLCLIPGLRCATPLPGDSSLVRHSLNIAAKYFEFLFNSAGTYHFKSRFRPRFENRYLCAWPRMTFGSSWSFIKILGVLNLDLAKLWHAVIERLR